jgi:hypothetical protein
MNRAIELHDSVLAILENVPGAIRVLFEPAYVHETEGVPGVDPGIGWWQTIELFVNAGSVQGRLTALSSEVSDGSLTADGREYGNLVPLPISFTGEVKLDLRLKTGESVLIRGSAIRSGFEGRPEDPEEFPGCSRLH